MEMLPADDWTWDLLEDMIDDVDHSSPLFSEFSALVEGSLLTALKHNDQRAAEHDVRLSEEEVTLPKTTVDPFPFEFEHRRILYGKHFPELHRESLFLSAHSQLENNLNAICDALQRCLNLDIRLRDMYGAGVERAFLYLRVACRWQIPAGTALGEFIAFATDLRNAVVHRGGTVEEDGKLIKQLKGRPGLSVSEEMYIVFGSGFLPVYFDHLNQLANFLRVEATKTYPGTTREKRYKFRLRNLDGSPRGGRA